MAGWGNMGGNRLTNEEPLHGGGRLSPSEPTDNFLVSPTEGQADACASDMVQWETPSWSIDRG